jgi:hypothetical protein
MMTFETILLCFFHAETPFCGGPLPPTSPPPLILTNHKCISTYTFSKVLPSLQPPTSAAPESVSVDMMAEGIKGATDHRSLYGEKLDIEGGRGVGRVIYHQQGTVSRV